MIVNNIAKDELIGRQVKIYRCKDPKWVNISGKIIDETKNTFLLEIGNEKKRIAKEIAIFEIEYQGKKTKIEGSRLMYKPEDRIKKSR